MIILVLYNKSLFGLFIGVPKIYTLYTPGFGEETYTVPSGEMLIPGYPGSTETENLPQLTAKQYSVFVKYMQKNEKIANFMSDNSQVSIISSSISISDFIGSSNGTISYNQAVGIHSGTTSGIGQSLESPTIFQFNRTLLIIAVINGISNLYCSNPDANEDTSSDTYVSDCELGDLSAELERDYYLSKDVSLDMQTYSVIWYALFLRYKTLVDRLGENVITTL